MKNNYLGGAQYLISPFMYCLGIENITFSVYAALYAFSVGERGLFHGSKQYLADSIHKSVRSVQNSFNELFSLGLIEKYQTPDGRYKGVRCVMEKVKEAQRLLDSNEEKRRSRPEKKAESEPQKAVSPDTKSPTAPKRSEKTILRDEFIERDEYTERDEFMEKMLPPGAPEHQRNTVLMMRKYEKSGDNRKFLSFGRSGGVKMTEPQYKCLLDLLPTEELTPYFTKLEAMLEGNIQNGRKPPHSHYKLIKKWISEDTAL